MLDSRKAQKESSSTSKQSNTPTDAGLLGVNVSLISDKQDTGRNEQAKGDSSSEAPSESNDETWAHIERIGWENFKGSRYDSEA